MNLRNIVAVSGESVLYTLVANKNNGLLLENMDTKRTKFFSMRLYQFTPLETVGIYTDTDTVELAVIFKAMLDHEATHPVPSPKDDNQTLHTYFGNILTNYDRDRVYASDIKKVVKWYNFLKSKDLVVFDEEATTEKADTEQE